MSDGYPTSSFGFREMIPFLEEDYFVAVLDFPGFGFSDKPQDGYSYMLEDDAKLVDHFVRQIVGLSRFHLLTHDRGGSVGVAFLGNYLAREEKEYEITYHFISNGGLFLPLTNGSLHHRERLLPRGRRVLAGRVQFLVPHTNVCTI